MNKPVDHSDNTNNQEQIGKEADEMSNADLDNVAGGVRIPKPEPYPLPGYGDPIVSPI